MQKGKDGHFRTQVDLKDGVYQYKFRVQSKSWFFEPDEWVDLVDPYATDIDNPTQNGVVRIKDGQTIVDTYVWQHDDKPLPADHELVIYEMHLADFLGEQEGETRSKFQQAIDRLDYLCDLGVNAIELMPMQEFPGDYSWGYNTRHFFAVESSYGTTQDFKQFVDECHARGIRIILDAIYNHSESEAPLTKINYDYWFHHDPKDPEYHWGPEFNYEHYDEKYDVRPAWKFVGDAVRFWVQEYHIDGIRYDAAKQLGNYDFMHWITQEAKQTAGSKPFYNIAEFIPEDPNITNLDGPMDACWHDSFHHTIVPHLCADRFDMADLEKVIDCKQGGLMGVTNAINYLTNHDHDQLMQALAKRDVFDEAAFKRAKLGAVLSMTAVGVPLVWMGEEFGNSREKTIDPVPLDWSLLDNENNRGLFEYYKGLIYLRKTNYALYTENIDFFHKDEDSKVFAYCRWNEEGSRIVVVVNFSDNYLADYQVPLFPKNGTWHEWTGNYDIEVEEEQLTIDLPEYEAKVLVC